MLRNAQHLRAEGMVALPRACARHKTDSTALWALVQHAWPGNGAELRGVLLYTAARWLACAPKERYGRT